MGQEYVTFAILERAFMSMYNAGQNTLMDFTADITLSANIGFYPKFSDTFAAGINARPGVVNIKEPTMAHAYSPTQQSPVKPPPKSVTPESTMFESGLLNSLSSTVIKSLMPEMPSMKWLSEAATAMGETGGSSLKFAVDAAPYAMEAAEFLLPLLISEPPRISARAEIKRYEAVIA